VLCCAGCCAAAAQRLRELRSPRQSPAGRRLGASVHSLERRLAERERACADLEARLQEAGRIRAAACEALQQSAARTDLMCVLRLRPLPPRTT
jgi:hypothetical protein